MTRELSIPIFAIREGGAVEYQIDGLIFDYGGQILSGVGKQIKGLPPYSPRHIEDRDTIYVGLEPHEIAAAGKFLKK